MNGKKLADFTEEDWKEFELTVKIASKRDQIKFKLLDDGHTVQVSMPLPNLRIVK